MTRVHDLKYQQEKIQNDVGSGKVIMKLSRLKPQKEVDRINKLIKAP
jgi:hypothetical protein